MSEDIFPAVKCFRVSLSYTQSPCLRSYLFWRNLFPERWGHECPVIADQCVILCEKQISLQTPLLVWQSFCGAFIVIHFLPLPNPASFFFSQMLILKNMHPKFHPTACFCKMGIIILLSLFIRMVK